MEKKKLMVFSFLKKTSFGRINDHFTPHNEMEFSSRIDIQLYGSRWKYNVSVKYQLFKLPPLHGPSRRAGTVRCK